MSPPIARKPRRKAPPWAAEKETLRAATDKAVEANPVYRAVSVVPAVKVGRASAGVILVKGEAWKTSAEPIK